MALSVARIKYVNYDLNGYFGVRCFKTRGGVSRTANCSGLSDGLVHCFVVARDWRSRLCLDLPLAS